MNFIGEWFLEDNSVCDDIIDFFNNSDFAKENKRQGSTTEGVNINYKDSVDLCLKEQDCINYPCLSNYLKQLQVICDKYSEKYPWCNRYASWGITEGINIQYYKPGGGFKQWHTERVNGYYPNVSRHLVFQTFLNDVEDAGQTQFYHQKIKVKAEKGKTIMWPVDWTHTHRGIVSKTQEKYVITGWFSFY